MNSDPVSSSTFASSRPSFGKVASAALLGVLFGACNSGSGGAAAPFDPNAGDDTPIPGNTGNAELILVEQGRLVDVLGFQRTSEGLSLALFRSDVVISSLIEDGRPTGSGLSDADVEFDFLAADVDTLTPRLLIPREIGTEAFSVLFDRLDDALTAVTAAQFGQDIATRPFPVVPRNSALKLTFSESLEVSDDFFVVRDENGDVNSVRNSSAIQLLRIIGDPSDDEGLDSDFELLPTRVIPRGAEIVLDPVFLGVEGIQYNTRNNASGLPASGDQFGANIRIAIALEGPLALGGVTGGATSFVSRNNDGALSIIRDFRSGNSSDTNDNLARGFIRDPEPPRIVGALPFLLVSVDDLDTSTQLVSVFKNGRVHEIDRGDLLRIVDTDTNATVLTEVVTDPEDDAFLPGEQFVRVEVRRALGLRELDPRLLPGFPSNPQSAEGQAFLRANAPRAVLLAEFTGRRFRTESGVPVEEFSDSPENFLTFTPAPLAQVEGFDPFPGQPSLPSVNVSPFAGAVVRFSKPVDLESVKAFDTFFFATRDVLDDEARDQFVIDQGIDLDLFNEAKYATPFLIDARVFDETGSQTQLRLQPVKGFYLDEEMRRPIPPDFFDIPVGPDQSPVGSSSPAPPHPGITPDGYSSAAIATTRLPYFLHLLGGLEGIRDLAGNPIDFQADGGGVEDLTIPFFLDGRRRLDGTPFFEENLAVSIVRRFAHRDEDEQPSIFLASDPAEYPFAMRDTFGSVEPVQGRLVGRNPTRVSAYVDDLNQQSPPPQSSIFRWCPAMIGGDTAVATASASIPFPAGIQNPFNPFGARVQMVWREIDMSLSRVDPADFNLDVEQLFWAPVTTATLFFDIFDEVSMFLGHSEYRPEPCVGGFSALPVLAMSGLDVNDFADNFAHQQLPTGTGNTVDLDRTPAPHPAFLGRQFVINPGDVVLEPNGINRYLSVPQFRQPFFTWRDETVAVQGGMTMQGDDTLVAGTYAPYIISPWLGGQVAPLTITMAGDIAQAFDFWDNRANRRLQSNGTDNFTGGLLGTIALPLLAEFQTVCDSPDLPAGAGFIADGFNGWQISLSVQSNPSPNFRAFSSGDPSLPGDGCISAEDDVWQDPSGDPGAAGSPTGIVPGDNSVHWVRADFIKRQSVATSGFVEIDNPHRLPPRAADDLDPRIGPFFPAGRPNNVIPVFEWHFEPPLDQLANGTSVVPEFRAASAVTANWRMLSVPDNDARLATGAVNPPFFLNPLVACDSHIRKYDDRSFNGGSARNYWSHYYNEHVTDYTTDISDLFEQSFLDDFSGPSAADNLTRANLFYFNWRLIMAGNANADPAVAPSIESFAISYRFERVVE